LLTAGQENPRTPAPPVYGGPSPCELGRAPQCFGRGTSEGVFFNPRAEIRPRGGSNPGPLGSASSDATTTIAGLWRKRGEREGMLHCTAVCRSRHTSTHSTRAHRSDQVLRDT